MSHFIEICDQGYLVTQCRCPDRNKTVRVRVCYEGHSHAIKHEAGVPDTTDPGTVRSLLNYIQKHNIPMDAEIWLRGSDGEKYRLSRKGKVEGGILLSADVLVRALDD